MGITILGRCKPLEWETNEQGCHLVTSHYIGNHGYIMIRSNMKRMCAHRVIYREHYGEIPEGMVVMHSCDNRTCINPEHLSLGTHRDNALDMINKGRKRNAKLTGKDVIWIRTHGKGMSLKQLSEKFGVTEVNISKIKNKRTWKHV